MGAEGGSDGAGAAGVVEDVGGRGDAGPGDVGGGEGGDLGDHVFLPLVFRVFTGVLAGTGVVSEGSWGMMMEVLTPSGLCSWP